MTPGEKWEKAYKRYRAAVNKFVKFEKRKWTRRLPEVRKAMHQAAKELHQARDDDDDELMSTVQDTEEPE